MKVSLKSGCFLFLFLVLCSLEPPKQGWIKVLRAASLSLTCSYGESSESFITKYDAPCSISVYVLYGFEEVCNYAKPCDHKGCCFFQSLARGTRSCSWPWVGLGHSSIKSFQTIIRLRKFFSSIPSLLRVFLIMNTLCLMLFFGISCYDHVVILVWYDKMVDYLDWVVMYSFLMKIMWNHCRKRFWNLIGLSRQPRGNRGVPPELGVGSRSLAYLPWSCHFVPRWWCIQWVSNLFSCDLRVASEPPVDGMQVEFYYNFKLFQKKVYPLLSREKKENLIDKHQANEYIED